MECFFFHFSTFASSTSISSNFLWSTAVWFNMESENSIQMSRPKTQRRLNLDSSQKLPHINNIRSSSFDMASMSPMTNLVHNLSGASLDSTPKRRFLSHGNLRFQQLKGYITTNNAFPVCGVMVDPFIFRSTLMPTSCFGLTCGLVCWKVHKLLLILMFMFR